MLRESAACGTIPCPLAQRPSLAPADAERTMMATVVAVEFSMGVTMTVAGMLRTPSSGMATSADAVSPAGSTLPSASGKPAWSRAGVGACVLAMQVNPQRLSLLTAAMLPVHSPIPLHALHMRPASALSACLTTACVGHRHPAQRQRIAAHAGAPQARDDGVCRHRAGHGQLHKTNACLVQPQREGCSGWEGA